MSYGKMVRINQDNFWLKLFFEHVLANAHLSDDLIFYVEKQFDVTVNVIRRGSKINWELLKNPYVDWEETVYLNFIMQRFEYDLTCCVCAKIGMDVQVLKKVTHPVYPSPSRRRMDKKGEEEIITYPDIFFSVDNYDELFRSISLREHEFICIELVCRTKSEQLNIPSDHCFINNENTLSKFFEVSKSPQPEAVTNNILLFSGSLKFHTLSECHQTKVYKENRLLLERFTSPLDIAFDPVLSPTKSFAYYKDNYRMHLSKNNQMYDEKRPNKLINSNDAHSDNTDSSKHIIKRLKIPSFMINNFNKVQFVRMHTPDGLGQAELAISFNSSNSPNNTTSNGKRWKKLFSVNSGNIELHDSVNQKGNNTHNLYSHNGRKRFSSQPSSPTLKMFEGNLPIFVNNNLNKRMSESLQNIRKLFNKHIDNGEMRDIDLSNISDTTHGYKKCQSDIEDYDTIDLNHNIDKRLNSRHYSIGHIPENCIQKNVSIPFDKIKSRSSTVHNKDQSYIKPPKLLIDAKVTYITLPLKSIIQRIMEMKEKPVLTF